MAFMQVSPRTIPSLQSTVATGKLIDDYPSLGVHINATLKCQRLGDQMISTCPYWNCRVGLPMSFFAYPKTAHSSVQSPLGTLHT